ncbi:MAG: right-handed parallel beta-helix repeat-containing protein [Planctomycetes bacterium]|nr:right-handed parallel beta-helix repeat-containing protein [Planctomycetota bacterium]
MIRLQVRFATLAALALAFFAPTASAATIYVDVNLTTGANNGSSWADAYRTVDGVAVALAASVAGDEIWVAQGTYKPTTTLTRTIYFTLKTGVAVYGGFVGTETMLVQRNFALNVTTLSGDLLGDDGSNLFNDNSFHVINANSATATAILDGFVVTGGNANSSANQDRGGGILMLANSNATVRNCTFRANRCTFGGGAGYINSSSPTFTDCRFENNVGGSFGGAFDQASGVGTVFTRCVFTGNTAARAGAIEIFSSSPVKVYDCIFYNNSCTGSGGGGAIFVSGSSPSFRNTLVYGNTSTVSSAAGFIASGSTVDVANCIVYGNTGPGGAQGAVNQLSGSTYIVSYSCVQGGFGGTGNISADPGIVNPVGGDFHSQPTSPCIDAGSNALIPPALTVDFDLRPRLADEPSIPNSPAGFVDMGPFEYPVPSITRYCFGDGFLIQCPCGNNSSFLVEEGCLSSIGVGGALSASGNARYSNDTVILSGTQMTNGPCLYFQGTTKAGSGIGVQFGDGLLCVSGSIIRLGVVFNTGGASQFPNGGPSLSAAGFVTGAGAERTYQVWFRDAAAFCSAATNNLTSAVSIVWEQ